MTKPLHAGRAAESGVVACDLVGFGWSAADKILESPRGFFQAHGGGYDLGSIKGKLGKPWTFDKPGISIKPHPCGSLTHPGMTKMLELILKHDIKPQDVVKVDVGTNHNMQNALIHHRPTNEFQAKFSMEYSMAILLVQRRAYIPEYQDKRVNKPDVQNMLRKINFYKNAIAEKAGYDKMTTIIDIYLKNGKDDHRNVEKGERNDSARSLIWSFWEQIVFLKKCEKASKLSKLVQFWVQAVCLTTRLRKVIG